MKKDLTIWLAKETALAAFMFGLAIWCIDHPVDPKDTAYHVTRFDVGWCTFFITWWFAYNLNRLQGIIRGQTVDVSDAPDHLSKKHDLTSSK